MQGIKMQLPIISPKTTKKEQMKKIDEETTELCFAIYNSTNVLEELFDSVQANLGLMMIFKQENPAEFKKAELNHMKKLIERGWDIKGMYKVEFDEYGFKMN